MNAARAATPVCALVALAAVTSAAPAAPGRSVAEARSAGVRYLLSRAGPGGGFSEPGAAPTSGLTAWAVLGLRAAGVPSARLAPAQAFLASADSAPGPPTDAQLALVARASLGERPAGLVARVRAIGRGPTVNSAIWAVLALRAVGERPPPAAVRFVLQRQTASGGWSWAVGGAPDSNDTAAAVQALRAAGVGGRPIVRALAFLRRHQRADGGFELTRGRGSDVQSTAWCVQAFAAAGRPPPAGALRYLLRLQRPDGSFRYSARYVTTPAWVTAQALAALARRSLPLRALAGERAAPVARDPPGVRGG